MRKRNKTILSVRNWTFFELFYYDIHCKTTTFATENL